MIKGDKLVIVIVFLVAVILAGSFWLWKSHSPVTGAPKVVVEVNGQIETQFLLSDIKPEEHYRIKGILGYSFLEGGDNKVRMVESPCPDKICMGMGWISQPGESIVCIPNRVVVRIVGEGDYDSLSQ